MATKKRDEPAGSEAKSLKLPNLIGTVEKASARMASMDYWLILVISVVLAIFGVIMVQSSASVEAIAKGKDGFRVALSQGGFAALGIALMLIMQKMKPTTLKRFAGPSVLLAMLLLGLVAFTPLGHEVLGNRNWIRFGSGGFGLQPSEFAKLALAVYAAAALERKQHVLNDWKQLLIPVILPVGGIIVFLVVYGKDVGTALVLLMIIATAMFLGGLRVKYLLGLAAFAFVGLSLAIFSSENRRSRIFAWLDTDCGPADKLCYQASMGLHAFASGGWFGVGAGQSRMKWSYVPEAQNDFIFSILGEEFGLLGVLFVLIMFIVLALAMYRIAVRASDMYTKVLMGCLMAWIIGQTFVNLGTVTGVLPVIGVPLPFISSGGSAMLAIMLAMGYVLSSARAQKLEFEEIPGSKPAKKKKKAK